ncbi:MAG: methylmalonyl Co-A mutase-associated GTPase MeaB [Polyangiaceae bacterium]
MVIDEFADLDELWSRILARDRRSLAKAITLVESQRDDHRRLADSLLERVALHGASAERVGISGVPGAGKSTFIETLGLRLIDQGHRVAVLAVDPSSRLSGGSILGDKTRMPRLSAAAEAFIRPSPAAGTLGGVARRTREAMLLCEAAGFDVVLVETVGVGQSEHAVYDLVDSFLLLALAGAGDELQGIKRGILELVDVVCINKADGDNEERATRACAETKAALRLLRGQDCPEVFAVSALTGAGVGDAWNALQAHHARARASGALETRRARQRGQWLDRLLEDGLRGALAAHPTAAARLATLRREVEAGKRSPSAAAREVLEAFLPGSADSED